MRHGERLVTLVDGRQVSSYSEDWRHECECRAILELPTLAERRAHLDGTTEWVRFNGKWVEKRTRKGLAQTRGAAELERIKDTMRALWLARQGGSAQPAANDAQAQPARRRA